MCYWRRCVRVSLQLPFQNSVCDNNNNFGIVKKKLPKQHCQSAEQHCQSAKQHSPNSVIRSVIRQVLNAIL